MYRVFIRNWYVRREGRIVPGPGPKSYIPARFDTEDEARAWCQQYNRSHEPGVLSRKAEYERHE